MMGRRLCEHGSRRRTLLTAAAVVLAVTAAGGVASAAPTGSAGELRHRATDARATERALAGDISAQNERIDGLQQGIGSLSGQVAELEAALSRSRSRLRAVEAELAEKTKTLARARRELRVAQQRLSGRLVEIYTSGEPDTLAVVLGASSLDELVDLVEARDRVLEHDDGLVDTIATLRTNVTRDRTRAAALRKQRADETTQIASRADERRSALSRLIARRDSLAALRSARQRSLASVRVDRQAWEAQADALEAESARLAAVAAAAPPPATSASPAPAPGGASAGGFSWPVRGSVVSPFGQRWGRLHAGIDIAAPAGTPIAAAAAGSVSYAGSMSGYGLVVVVQHANGVSTVYAHNSSLSVSTGQAVGQGQTIAAVGCTGHCFGDHVHFEVRVGGSPVDPMGYL